MNTYFVTWLIEVDADSPEQAAELALEIQQDSESEATHFIVRDMWNNKGQMIHVIKTENHNDS